MAMNGHVKDEAVPFGDELRMSQNRNSAASVGAIKPISLPGNSAPINPTSSKVALQLLITKIQNSVLNHERALRLIGSRMPLFDAMDEMKEWLKSTGKHAPDEEYDWCRDKLNTLLNNLDQQMQRAETALKEFHDLRQLILRSLKPNPGEGSSRARLRPDQEEEMRKLLETTDRWFQNFPHNLPQTKPTDEALSPLELFITQIPLIKKTYDSIMDKSEPRIPEYTWADLKIGKDVRGKKSFKSETKSEVPLQRTNVQQNRDTRDSTRFALEPNVIMEATRMEAQQNKDIRGSVPPWSGHKITSNTSRTDLQSVKIVADTKTNVPDPTVLAPTAKISLSRTESKTSVNTRSSKEENDKEHVIVLPRSNPIARDPTIFPKTSSIVQPGSEEPFVQLTKPENKQVIVDSLNSEHADDFKIKWNKTKQSSQSGESVIGTRSEIFPIRKHYVTAGAQTRIPSRCLTIDAASDHQQMYSDGKNHGAIEISSVKPVESKPTESTNSILKEHNKTDQVQFQKLQPTDMVESDLSDSLTIESNKQPTRSKTPGPGDKSAFRYLDPQSEANESNEKVDGSRTNLAGGLSPLPFHMPLTFLLELIRQHEIAVGKQTRKLVLTKYMYDGPSYHSVRGVNRVLQRLWADVELHALPMPALERLKEKLVENERLQQHLVDLYSDPQLIRELRTVIEQYKGSSRLSLDSITSSLETCSRWLKAKSKEVSDEHAEMYRLIREDTKAYKQFLIDQQSLVYNALDSFLSKLDEPEISIKEIRESEAESSVADYQGLQCNDYWKLPRFRLRNTESMVVGNSTRPVVRKRYARVTWKDSHSYTN